MTVVKQSNPKEFENKNVRKKQNNKTTTKNNNNKMKRKGREVNKNRLGLILPTEPELRCCRDLAVGPRFASQQVQTRHTTF